MSTKLIDTFEAIVNNELSNKVLPIKTKHGIRLGNVEIISDRNLKHIKINNRIQYEGIFLNVTAITLANMLFYKKSKTEMEKIYKADQAYGRFFIDSQILRYHYNMALQDQDSFRVDLFWSRYTDKRDKVLVAKKQVEQLIRS